MKVPVKVAGDDEVLVIVAGEVVTTVPSYLIVMVALGAKPDPDTVTMVPGVPSVGLRVIPIETPKTALAKGEQQVDGGTKIWTKLVPNAPVGTVRVVESPPPPSLITEPTAPEQKELPELKQMV